MEPNPTHKSHPQNHQTERTLEVTYLYCGRCDMFTPTEDIYGNERTTCGNCGRWAPQVDRCPTCHEEIREPESMEDRWGTKFCSVRCCDEYHESTAAEMMEA